MLKRIMQWFCSSVDHSLPTLIILGVGYNSHYVSGKFSSSDRFRVVAMIDDEPWNHRNLMNGAVIYYPGELLALVEKHKVCAVIQFEGEGVDLPCADYEKLEALQCSMLTVPSRISSVADKLEYILQRISA